MDTPLIAPSTSPISKALDVPIAWDDVPRAAPTATGSLIFNSLNIIGPKIFPITPVITITDTVREGMPPIFLDISIPIGVVMLLGSRLSIISSSKLNRLDQKKTDVIATIEPTKIPNKSVNPLSLSMDQFLYNGMAKATVAGPRKIDINFPPVIYCSYEMLFVFKIIIIVVIVSSTGFSNAIFVFC